MTDANDLIKNARLPEARVPLCLRGDLLSRLPALEAELDRAHRSDSANSLASGGEARIIAQQIEDLHREIEENTHIFLFRAMAKREFRDLQESYPPRAGHPVDAAMGFDVEAFQVPLIAECCVDPEMTEEQAGELVDVLSDGQVLELFTCALSLNRGKVDLPKFETASSILARQGPRSRPPEPGGSAVNGSSAGSLAG